MWSIVNHPAFTPNRNNQHQQYFPPNPLCCLPIFPSFVLHCSFIRRSHFGIFGLKCTCATVWFSLERKKKKKKGLPVYLVPATIRWEPISNHFRSRCQMITGLKTQAWCLFSWTYWKFDSKRRWFIFPMFNGNGAFWSAQCMKVQKQCANNNNNKKLMISDLAADCKQRAKYPVCTVQVLKNWTLQLTSWVWGNVKNIFFHLIFEKRYTSILFEIYFFHIFTFLVKKCEEEEKV